MEECVTKKMDTNKQPYNSPEFIRYGNVRDLTQAVVSVATQGLDHHSTQRTH
jgi:hypothetical protein